MAVIKDSTDIDNIALRGQSSIMKYLITYIVDFILEQLN